MGFPHKFFVNSKIDKILNENRNNHKIQFDKTIDIIEEEVKYDLIVKKDKTKEVGNDSIQIIKESDFQSIMKHQNRSYSNLKNKNDIYYIADKSMTVLYESLENKEMNLPGENKTFIINKQYTDLLFNKQSTTTLVVVKDNAFNEFKTKEKLYRLRAIDISNESTAINMSMDIENIVNKNMTFTFPFNFTSSITTYKTSLEINGLMLFIGIFLSIIFLLCTGSIILFKQLSSIYANEIIFTNEKRVYIMLSFFYCEYYKTVMKA